jgi:hypothetical protein
VAVAWRQRARMHVDRPARLPRLEDQRVGGDERVGPGV